MSQAGANSTSGGGGSGIQEIDGNSGSVSGTIVTLTTGTTQGTTKFTGSGTTMTMTFSSVDHNTFIGSSSPGTLITSGEANVGFGDSNSVNLTSGSNNSFIGDESGLIVSSGSDNTSVGQSTLNSLITGDSNTAIGSSALAIVTNSNNTALGKSALETTGTGHDNIGIGVSAGSQLATGDSSNILIGSTGTNSESNAIHIGTQGAGSGQQNKAFMAGIVGVTTSNSNFVTIDTTTGQLGATAGGGSGVTSLAGNSGGALTGALTVTTGAANANGTSVFTGSGTTITQTFSDADDNTGLGTGALSSIIAGAQDNTAFGSGALAACTTGSLSVAVGFQALNTITDNGFNCAVGSQAMHVATGTCTNNTALGNFALYSIDDPGINSTSVGMGSLQQSVGGSHNIAVGFQAGFNYTTTESSNIMIGNAGTITESNVIRIGVQGSGDAQQDTCFIAGIDGSTVTGSAVLVDTNGQLGDIVSSIKYKDNVKDIQNRSILDLRPVQFNYKSDKSKTTTFGLIAEEVHKVFPDLVLYKDKEPYSVKYHEMSALLLNEIQKLRAEVNELKARLA